MRTTQQWIRFEHEDEPYGVFSYVSDARAVLGKGERAELQALLEWFGEHLGAPDELTHERCWFRAEALEHVERARRMADLMVIAGIPIIERRTRRVPGKIRWEDPEQVAVFTYRDAPRSRKGPPFSRP